MSIDVIENICLTLESVILTFTKNRDNPTEEEVLTKKKKQFHSVIYVLNGVCNHKYCHCSHETCEFSAHCASKLVMA